MADQSLLAIDEADIVLFLVEAQSGLTHADRMIAEKLRLLKRSVTSLLIKPMVLMKMLL